MANQLKYTNHILRKSAESVAVVGVPANKQMKSSLRSNVGGDANIRHSQLLRKSAGENLRFSPRFRTLGSVESRSKKYR
jgi:hypothetical protein